MIEMRNNTWFELYVVSYIGLEQVRHGKRNRVSENVY